jgi:diguanylate cyclase
MTTGSFAALTAPGEPIGPPALAEATDSNHGTPVHTPPTTPLAEPVPSPRLAVGSAIDALDASDARPDEPVDATLTSLDAALLHDTTELARPLLELAARLTGLPTTFVTTIDWQALRQRVVSVHTDGGEPRVSSGSEVDWRDSMCRRIFLSGSPSSSDVAAEFPDSLGTEMGMGTFMALPIQHGDDTVGTLCATGPQHVSIDPHTLESLRLVAEAMGTLIATTLRRPADDDVADGTDGADHGTHPASLARTVAHLRRLAHTDDLTGLHNRRGFESVWEQRLATAGRTGRPLGLLVIDLDDFKALNDRHGHGAGDAALRTAAEVIVGACRASDVVARMGGDELVVGLTDADTATCRATAARIAEALAAARVPGLPEGSLRASIGVACSDGTPLDALADTADAAMYRVKASRRVDAASGSRPVSTGEPRR